MRGLIGWTRQMYRVNKFGFIPMDVLKARKDKKFKYSSSLKKLVNYNSIILSYALGFASLLVGFVMNLVGLLSEVGFRILDNELFMPDNVFYKITLDQTTGNYQLSLGPILIIELILFSISTLFFIVFLILLNVLWKTNTLKKWNTTKI